MHKAQRTQLIATSKIFPLSRDTDKHLQHTLLNFILKYHARKPLIKPNICQVSVSFTSVELTYKK